jgi:hypothetical protein
VVPVLVLNLVQSLYWLFAGGSHAFGISAILSIVLNILVALALLVFAFLARLFALGVQDRVIRLEERRYATKSCCLKT